MTQQQTLVTIGAAATLAAKFALGKDWKTAALLGVGAALAWAVLSARTPQTA